MKKRDFIIKTQDWSQFWKGSYIEKSGKVRSSQDITLTSNAAGRVNTLRVKAGDTVKVWQVLATLSDTVGSYALTLSQAENGVDRAKINFDSNKLQIEKQIFDSEQNLATLERKLKLAKDTAEQNLLQAEDSLSNSNIADGKSTASLQVEQLKNNLKKAKLEYDNKIIADDVMISGFSTSLKQQMGTLTLSLDDVIEFSDRLLGVTDNNKWVNTSFDYLLGAKDSTIKNSAKDNLRDIIAYRNSSEYEEYSNLFGKEMDSKQTLESINYIDTWYKKVIRLLADIEQTLNASISSIGQFPESQIQWLIWQVNGYQGSIQGSYAGFLTFANNAKSFLKTYKNTQESLLTAIKLQEKDISIQQKKLESGLLSAEIGYKQTKLQSWDSIASLETQIESAKKSLDTVRKNLQITLRSLNNGIKEAQIGYSKAVKEYAKLTITSPINGTIANTMIDEGQEVNMGTQMISIVSDDTPEVQVGLSAKEKSYIQKDMDIEVMAGDQILTWKVYAVSDVADAALNYQTTIVFESGVNIIGDIVTVKIPISTGEILLPLEILETQWDNIAKITVYSGGTFEQVRVRIGEIFWESVEIVSCAKNCNDLNVVLTDISNYDSTKFVITEKK